MNEKSLCCRGSIGICGTSLDGDSDKLRSAGDGVVRIEAVSEYPPPSDCVLCNRCVGRDAKTAAVAAAASSTVPVWWF